MLKNETMKNVYDIIIIGSGLNALATLYGILQSKKYKIALITGKPSLVLNIIIQNYLMI